MSSVQGSAGSTTAGWQPQVVALVCNWCTYAGADMAGTTRLEYPATVRIVRFPCTGRINPLHVIRAFEQGADGVLVSGCHPGDCHYVHGNLVARRRAAVLRSLLELLGINPRRLHFTWVSASEGAKWARVVEEVTNQVRSAGPLGQWAGPPTTVEPIDLPGARGFLPSPSTGDPDSQTASLRELVSTLLAEGTVATVIGYAPGATPGRMVPHFVSDASQVADLAFNDHCATNLLAYLPRTLPREGRVGVVVKACDLRGAVMLQQERQLQRDQVVLIGMGCSGQHEGGVLARKCRTCNGEPNPNCDHVIAGERLTAADGEDGREDPRDAEIAFLESLPPEQRWAYWQRQLARCLRCYACRAVCPLCYCETCVAEKHRPQLVSTAIDARGNLAWAIVRALHHAGRCSGCDECARVCPAGVRLDLLNRKLAREVEARFGYRAGDDASASPVLADFRIDDAEEFIR